jgi:20S proteasome alpha/beta subunit
VEAIVERKRTRWLVSRLTIVVGIKCKDGVIVSTDTQAEFGRGVDVKRLNANKIHHIGAYAIAGAGTIAHVEKAVDAIRRGFLTASKEMGEELEESQCIDTLEKTITAVYKEYNIDRSRFLDDPRERDFFDPILIFCGTVQDDDVCKSCLSIVHSVGLVEPIHDYATAGSGAAYAELILKNYYRENLKLSEAVPIAIYTVNEVKQIDPGCGGDTQVAIVEDGKGIRMLSDEEVKGIGSKAQEPLDLIWKQLIGKVLTGEVDIGKLKEI